MGAGGGAGGAGGAGARGGGGGAPGAAAAATPGRRGGCIALDLRRGKSSKKLLEIEWTHPVHKPAEPKEPAKPGTTVAGTVERALPPEEAWLLVADGDKRPLLVMRECELCKGSDHALLNRSLDNEQTVLLTHWFRCVKLPPNVIEEKHPLHALFQRSKEGEPIPHLFFANADGSNRTPLPGDQSQSQLWEVMFGYLENCYEGDAKKCIKELRALLSDFDTVDALEQELKVRMDKELEKNGPESPKLKKLVEDQEQFRKRREKISAREKELRAQVRLESEGKPAAAAK